MPVETCIRPVSGALVLQKVRTLLCTEFFQIPKITAIYNKTGKFCPTVPQQQETDDLIIQFEIYSLILNKSNQKQGTYKHPQLHEVFSILHIELLWI
jgi:hypothetical protein